MATLVTDSTDRPSAGVRALRRVLYENGLSLVLGAMFLTTLVGQSIVGLRVCNDERIAHGQTVLEYAAYLRSEHFWEATFENWESEFLQMAAYVLLTVFLVQRGSAESNKLKETAPRRRPRRKPWPVRRGGFILGVYEHSLSLMFAALFVLSFVFHGINGATRYNQEQLAHGEAPLSAARYFLSSQFWFESLQNWQSEFLAIGSMVILSIFLRERGSPESKRVEAPHDETGIG